MTTVDPQLKETFPLPPMVAYRRPANLREKLIRAKVPKPMPSRPKRTMKGMRKCRKKSNFGECPLEYTKYSKNLQIALAFFSELSLYIRNPNLLKFLKFVDFSLMATHFCDNHFPFI